MAKIIRAALLCGVVAPVLWGVAIVLAGAMRPGFDHVGQYISELGERGSAHADIMRFGGFMATGFMHVAYALGFYATLTRLSGRHRLTLLVAGLIACDGLGRVGAGVFACEPGCAAPHVLGQRLHSLSASIAFLSIAAAASLGAMLFHGDKRLRPLAGYSLASGVVGLGFLWLMSAGAATLPWAGLFERLVTGVLSLWVFVTALRLLALHPGN